MPSDFAVQIIELLGLKQDINNWDGESSLPELTLAIWCLSEAPDKSKLSNVGELLFNQVIKLFQFNHVRLDRSYYEEIISACNFPDCNWPGEISIPEEMDFSLDGNWNYVYYPKFLAKAGASREKITYFANSERFAIRWGAIEALAENWPDIDTRQLLLDRAVQDKSEHVRCSALEALSKQWPDHSMRQFLLTRAVQDIHYMSRRTALICLYDHYPDDQTNEFLCARALQDTNDQPRSVALDFLLKKWPNDTIAKGWFAKQAKVDGLAASKLGSVHSKFGQFIFSEYLDGVGPYILHSAPRFMSFSN